MMIETLSCGTSGWFMPVAVVLTVGTLVLAFAGLVKYLFFADRTNAAGR